jgi:hypothetical protein
MRQPTIHQMRKKKSSRKGQGSRKLQYTKFVLYTSLIAPRIVMIIVYAAKLQN